MKSNRRSVLIGLGALTVGGGAVFGTGAFSQVDADRTVTVNTAGDGAALLAFTIEDSYEGVADGGESDVIQLDFGDEDGDGADLNQNAETTFDDVLTVTNNGSEGVELSVNSNEVPDALTFETESGEDLANGVDISDGASENITVIVDLITHDAPTGDQTVTFTADTDEFTE